MNRHRLPTLFLLLACSACMLPSTIEAGEFPVADKVIIEKAARQLHLLQRGKIFRSFRIALGMVPVGDKKQEGDFKTPEGDYILDMRNPNSDFFLSIHVSYPNAEDRREVTVPHVARDTQGRLAQLRRRRIGVLVHPSPDPHVDQSHAPDLGGGPQRVEGLHVPAVRSRRGHRW